MKSPSWFLLAATLLAAAAGESDEATEPCVSDEDNDSSPHHPSESETLFHSLYRDDSGFRYPNLMSCEHQPIWRTFREEVNRVGLEKFDEALFFHASLLVQQFQDLFLEVQNTKFMFLSAAEERREVFKESGKLYYNSGAFDGVENDWRLFGEKRGNNGNEGFSDVVKGGRTSGNKKNFNSGKKCRNINNSGKNGLAGGGENGGQNGLEFKRKNEGDSRGFQGNSRGNDPDFKSDSNADSERFPDPDRDIEAYTDRAMNLLKPLQKLNRKALKFEDFC